MDKAIWPTALGLGLAALVVADQRARTWLARRSCLLRTRRGILEVELTGTGPAVLVLHGAGGGFDQGTWLARTLGLRGYRVLSVSRPGYLGTPDRESIDDADELYVAALDELNIDRIAVIGASAGGISALTLAMRHPDRIRALVMLSAVSGATLSGGLPEVPLQFARGWFDGTRAFLSAARSAAGRRLLAELVSTFVAPERRARGVLRDLRIAGTFRPPGGLLLPALVIHGTRDITVPFEHGLHAAELCASGELVRIDGGGHLCCMTHPEVAARVRAFLATQLDNMLMTG